jgi:hypothetical protein
MNSKIIASLFKTYLSIVMSSIIGVVATTIFLNSKKEIHFEPFMVFLFLFLYIFVGVLLCGFVLLPITIIDRKTTEEKTAPILIKRYLPIVTIPLSILLCCLLFADYNDINDYYYPLAIVLNIFFISYVGLWTFIKKIKSHSDETTH